MESLNPQPSTIGPVLKRWLPVALFCVLWLDLIRLLSGNWEAREQYAYGWFVPFLALGLLFRRWTDRPLPIQPSIVGGGTIVRAFVILGALFLLPLRVIFEINSDWPLIAWVYTVMVVGLTLYAFQLAGGWPWVRHFAFPVTLILVAVVWPYRIEKGLTQNLMQVVASMTVEILGWFDVPALQRGNLIEVATGTLGVDEACSGIRSFQSTLMVGLFLGELYRLRFWARAGLVVGGLGLAFGFNVIRTLILAWQANAHGLSAIDKWHDPAGFAIAIACFFALWLIAGLLKRKCGNVAVPNLQAAAAGDSSVASSPASILHPPSSSDTNLESRTLDDASQITGTAPRTLRSPLRVYLVALGVWFLFCLLATELWYRSHETKDAGVFHWTVAMPQSNPTYQRIDLPPRTLKLLAFDEGVSGSWSEGAIGWSTHFFRWQPRSIQAVLASRIHRPEVCLTAAGLQQLSESELIWLDAGQLKLPFRKYVFAAGGRRLFVFFCQWESGSEPQTGLAGTKQAGRLRSVLEGRRLLGQQTLEIILTGCDNLEQAELELRHRLLQLVQTASLEKSGTPTQAPVP